MKKFYCLFVSAVTALFLVGCQDEDFGVSQEQVFRSSYERNFINTFGDIPSEQDWDFSGVTRAMTDYSSIANDGEYFDVPKSLLTWMQTQLVEGQTPSFDVSSFTMIAQPNEVFEIVPIYLGKSWMDWKLNVVAVIDGEYVSKTIWTKQKHNIQVSSNGTTWKDFMVGANGGNGSTGDNDVKKLRAKPVVVDFSEEPFQNMTEDTPVFFTLSIISGHSGMGETGDEVSSISQTPNFVIFDCPSEVAGIESSEDCEIKIIGCDEESVDQDTDYNDAVFLVAGHIPSIAREEQWVYTTTKKRYLIEDLSSFDFDFNDIVVDVTETRGEKYEFVTDKNGEVTIVEIPGDENRSLVQEATIRYLCGTLPIQIKVGNFVFGQITDPTNLDQALRQAKNSADKYGDGSIYDPETSGNPGADLSTYTVTIADNSWDTENDNISVYVWQRADVIRPKESDGVAISSYPTPGTVPYIIAVTQNTPWTAEGVSFPFENYTNLAK